MAGPNTVSPTPALMLQGTGSDVGKSLILAGLARVFHRQGLRVCPFKPQNMSNNAAVAKGGEIGRAQALQARAAGMAPHVDMNPILLKPQSERGAQIIIQGKVAGTAKAADYQQWYPHFRKAILESFHRLSQNADLVLVEGAGSPAEINLRDRDVANMGFAKAANVPVILVGDIERGGVIASLTGTVFLLTKSERARLQGFIINKFRGDPALFQGGITAIEEHTSLPCLGLVPYCQSPGFLPAEDGVSFHHQAYQKRQTETGKTPRTARSLHIAVPHLPRVANFDDLDPLFLESGVYIEIVEPGSPLPATADLVLLLGSKATRSDLDAFYAEGWDIDLRAHIRRGGRVLGICGGYQMLGHTLSDPLGVEGPAGESKGLGLLDVKTSFHPRKIVRPKKTSAHPPTNPSGTYEIHTGRTEGPACRQPFFPDFDLGGATAKEGQIMGCYIHGLFSDDSFRRHFLAGQGTSIDPDFHYHRTLETALETWADHLETHLDCRQLLAIARR